MLILGHRGNPLVLRENTLASIESALQAGADGFETDLRSLADGTVVLFHDDEIGDVRVESLTFEALRSRTAVDCASGLSTVAGETLAVLEVKRRGWEDRLIDLVGTWENVTISSFDHELIVRLAKLRDSRQLRFQLGIIYSGYLVGPAAYARSVAADWVFPDYRMVDKRMVDDLHAAAIRVAPWTANDESHWNRLLEAGCDAVITDVPEAAVQWRKKAGLRDENPPG